MSSILFQKSVTSKLQKSKFTPHKARQIKRAIVTMDKTPMETLCKSGKVVKVNVKGRDNLYAYRVSSSGRILFSTENGTKIVQDIIDTDALSVKG